jgi:exosortase/archaeosortase
MQIEVITSREEAAKASTFNYNKLQAVVLMACSALVSIGIIYGLVKAFV